MTEEQAIEDVLDIARDEIGYHEGAGNRNKYAAYLDSFSGFYNGPKDGFAWCDCFFDYLFVKAFGIETGREMLCQPMNSAGAGCLYSAQYYKDAGRWFSTPQEGDQIFFSGYSHTGIVESVQGGNVITIEGNTSDQVARRSYSVSSASIDGYGRPRWELVTDKKKEPEKPTTAETGYSVVLPFLKRGDTGVAVKRLQTLLISHGYYCGGVYRNGIETPDGDFGSFTENAVNKFQSLHGITENKKVGAVTMKLLLTT